MKVKDVMTSDPVFCTPETTITDVAKMLAENDCGSLPVVESETDLRPIGVVTDRDITTRVVALGEDPRTLTARDVMSGPCVTVAPQTRLDICCDTMQKNLLRRVIVVDDGGLCCGIVAQADIARKASAGKAGDVVREVSAPSARSGSHGSREGATASTR